MLFVRIYSFQFSIFNFLQTSFHDLWHTFTHRYTHLHTSQHTYIDTHICRHHSTHTHTHRYTHLHTSQHTHIDTHLHTYTDTHICTHQSIHTETHTLAKELITCFRTLTPSWMGCGRPAREVWSFFTWKPTNFARVFSRNCSKSFCLFEKKKYVWFYFCRVHLFTQNKHHLHFCIRIEKKHFIILPGSKWNEI